MTDAVIDVIYAVIYTVADAVTNGMKRCVVCARAGGGGAGVPAGVQRSAP